MRLDVTPDPLSSITQGLLEALLKSFMNTNHCATICKFQHHTCLSALHQRRLLGGSVCHGSCDISLHISLNSNKSDNICNGSALRTWAVEVKKCRREDAATAVEAVAQEYE